MGFASKLIPIWMWIISFHTTRPWTIPLTITSCAPTFSSNGMRWTPQRTKRTHSFTLCCREVPHFINITIISKLEKKELDKRQMAYRGAVRLICSITSSVLSAVPHRSMLIATIKILSYHTICMFYCKFSQACLWTDGSWIPSIAASHFTRRANTVHSAFETGTERQCIVDVRFAFVYFSMGSASLALFDERCRNNLASDIFFIII